MFYYFGRKGRLARHYPAPEHDLVIEPFAGSAAYTLFWNPKNALLIDADPLVAELWHRICSMSLEEIRDYPVPEVGEVTSDPWVVAAIRSSWWRLGSSPTVSPWAQQRFIESKNFAMKNLDKAQKFEYLHGDYRDAPDVEATWFIDPPYQNLKNNVGYNQSWKTVDFGELADWCRSRDGLVIVCEQEGAQWLPFKHFREQQTGANKKMTELWWCNRDYF